jgi:hypothetical protein
VDAARMSTVMRRSAEVGSARWRIEGFSATGYMT